ncbi:MAG TPA: hypothetical protein VNK44_07645 [Candidatus Nitrosotenuis sp.]|nr:hypothetical protein [Candidatus Nitrosotenuis sp.]
MNPFYIFSKLISETITDVETFVASIDLAHVLEIIGIPLLFAFVTTIIKTRLSKENHVDDTFSNNLRFGVFILLVGGGTYALYFLITSLQH